jgi:hypothetical protein
MTRTKQHQNEATDESTAREPVGRVKLFPVEAAIWRNRNTEGDPFYAVTFARVYRDREGQWKSSSSFNTDDLLTLAKAADLAHSKIVELRVADRQANEPKP